MLLSSPAGTKMFQFPAFASLIRVMSGSLPTGCPIRTSGGQRVFAPRSGFSQLVTSFFASESLGIPHAPVFPFRNILYLDPRALRHRNSQALRPVFTTASCICLVFQVLLETLVCSTLLFLVHSLSQPHLSKSSGLSNFLSFRLSDFTAQPPSFHHVIVLFQSGE